VTTLETTLRELADAGAPAVTASPFLAERVLAHRTRTACWRRGGVALALLAATGGILALRSPSDGRFFDQGEPSSSMAPTVAIGEAVLADRDLRPSAGDVVVARFTDPEDGTFVTIKRVLAVSGDQIGCPAGPDGPCRAWVRNGVPLIETYVTPDDGTPVPFTTVPAGYLYLVGDNRGNSVDSRQLGPVEEGSVDGVAVLIRGANGRTRSVPGAPAHDGPVDDPVEPRDGPPPAKAKPVR
jgi:signal peptidase I